MYYSCCNTDLIQGRSDPSSFSSAPALLDQVLIRPSPHEWEPRRGAALAPATYIECHSGPCAVMQLLMGIAVSCESRGSLMEAFRRTGAGDRRAGEIGATSRAGAVRRRQPGIDLPASLLFSQIAGPVLRQGSAEEPTRDTTSESPHAKQSPNRSVLGDTLQ